ncbi:MAG TPA: tripartite tricarboxylate transporter substrate binding protein [Rubrivivax sp.]|nr:tripartite tricarboxylate transporter substrate binding protein [Rubrivivax sp.]
MSHSSSRRQILAAMAAAPLASPWLAAPARAQADFPAGKPIKVVCPYAAGSPVDVAGRYMADRLQSVLGACVVENIAGAGGTTGTAAVLRAPRDGHTLLTQFTSALVTTPFLYRTAKYDPVEDFLPIWSIASAGTVFVVAGNSPYKTLQDFMDAARAAPGKLSFGSAGDGSPPHINAEMFMRQTGLKLAHVPYRGSGQVITDIVGGHLDSQFSAVSAVVSLIADGRLRGLAVLRNERVPELPGVPTLEEAGIKGWEPPRSTFGLFAPAGTPAAVVERLTAILTQAYEADKPGQERLGKMGLRGPVIGKDLAALVRKEKALYGKLIEEAGIQPLS